MTLTLLQPRNCILREEDHKYIWDPDGVAEQMRTSVTSVVNHGKPPVDYSAYPEAAPRGTHVHRAMEAKVKGLTPPDPVSPEGIDCSAWFDQLNAMAFWDRIDLIASEYTMTDKRKSLGGQLDLLCVFKEKVLLIDLKTKSASWKGPSKDDIASYKAQAGGYLMLLQSGDDHHGGCWVDSCRTLVVTPTQTKWLSPMDPDDCSFAWNDCWDRYSAYLDANPFNPLRPSF